jgi:hypothetical protein
MEQGQAMQILGEWRELHDGEQAPHELEAHFWRAIAAALPDGCVAAAILLDGTPTVVAILGATVVEMSASLSPAVVLTRCRAIDRTRANCLLTETLEDVGGHPVVSGTARQREWVFDLADGQAPLRWSTRQVLAGGFGNERAVKPTERLARHMASALGWEMPTKDAEGPDWD